MDTVTSRHTEIPVIKRLAWLSRSQQGHLVAHWHCGLHWHMNGWDAPGDNGIRCAPHCVSDNGTVRLFVVGDATPAILRFIRKNRAPCWRDGARWPQKLLKEEIARLAPPAPRCQPRPQARRIRVRTPIRPRRSSVPARVWRAASDAIVAAWQARLASSGATVDKRAVSRLQRDAYRLLEQIDRDPAAAWRQLVVESGGDLDAGIAAAAMG